MIGQARLGDLLGQLVKSSPADQTMVCLWRNDTGVTRFAESRIHQHLHEEDLVVYVKVAHQGKVGVASTNSLDPAQLQRALQRALAIAEHTRSHPYLDFFPHPEAGPVDALYSPETAECTPQSRVETVGRVIEAARQSGLRAAGCFFTGEEEVAVINSVGRMAYQPMTAAGLKVIMLSDDASGYAQAIHRDLRQIDVAGLIERATQKCLDGRRPRELASGTYQVLLEPDAVAELLLWLSFTAFGAKAFHERTGFMHSAIGKRILAESITIYDDGRDPDGLPVPFDFEGQPKQRVMLIERGVGKGIVYDTHFAKMSGAKTTGHAMTPDDPEGPVPVNLFMAGGQDRLEDLVRKIDRGLLVTRFHYVNGFIHPRKATMTGMTRDGTFYIEGGQIRHPVINLRFTQSIVEAFQQVLGVSRERRTVGDLLDGTGSATVPAVALQAFTFTGLSK